MILRKTYIKGLLIACLVLLFSNAYPGNKNLDDAIKKLDKFKPDRSDSIDKVLDGLEMLTRSKPDKVMDSLTHVLNQKQMRVNIADAELRLDMSTYIRESRHQSYKVFQWQYISTILIFLIVALIVLSGVVYSALQFKVAYKHMKVKSKKQTDNPSLHPEATNIKIGLQGVEVSSSIFGIITLTLSIAFFYMYLVYVYPISLVDVTKNGSAKVELSK